MIQEQASAARTAGPERARLQGLNEREQALRAEMDRNRGELGRLLSALQLYSRDPPPALLVSPRSANDAVRAAILMRAVTPGLEERAKLLRIRADAYQQVRRQAALAQASLFLHESETAERRAEIERLIAENAGLEARLKADAEAAAPLARAAAEHDAALGGLVAGVDGQDPRPAAASADPGKLQAPVQGVRVTSFGVELASGGRSNGLAWRAGPGAQVWAPAGGVVEYAGPLKGWGQVVVIGLGGDWRLVLAGLDRLSVRAGAQLTPGQGSGLMGQAPSPELYMELRKGGGRRRSGEAARRGLKTLV